MSTIPILAVIDCANVLSKIKPGTVGNPTSLGAWQASDAYAYLIAPAPDIISNPRDPGNARSELTVQAQTGDTIQWSIVSIDRGLQYNAILQGIDVISKSFKGADPLSTPVSVKQAVKQFIGPPQRSATPFVPDSVAFTNYAMQTTVINDNQNAAILYHVVFYIADNKGAIQGYYTWDPFITVIN